MDSRNLVKKNAPTAAGYKFTVDDVIENYNEIISGGISRKYQLDFYCNSNVNYTVTENTTPTSYFLEINWSGIATYNFNKINAPTIELINDNDLVNASYYIKH
ncbi:MAG: hypothetical protein FGM16_02755 [Flavobacterium sp.]|nr:hypothetical protein [Flavobacterium sp.]